MSGIELIANSESPYPDDTAQFSYCGVELFVIGQCSSRFTTKITEIHSKRTSNALSSSTGHNSV